MGYYLPSARALASASAVRIPTTMVSPLLASTQDLTHDLTYQFTYLLTYLPTYFPTHPPLSAAPPVDLTGSFFLLKNTCVEVMRLPCPLFARHFEQILASANLIVHLLVL